MEVVSLIISILAIFGTLYTYIRHDKKIKEQERILNEYQIEKIKTEKDESKKALIKGNVLKSEKGKRTLKVFNAGKAVAFNINLEILNGNIEEKGVLNFHFEPYEMMNPQDSTETSFFLCEGHTPTLKIKFTWEDDFQDNNEFIQVLSI
ncbi:MAG: hypothetical protein RR277_00250 [Rikenellaceae bacterium]